MPPSPEYRSKPVRKLSACFAGCRRLRAAFFTLAVCTACCLLLCRDSRPLSRHILLSQLQSCPPLSVGDVLLRQGIGADSEIISRLSGGDYSHSGMVAAVSPQVVIIHAAAADDPDPARHHQVIVSSLPDFAGRAVRLAVRRYPLTAEQRQEIGLYLYSMLGEPFVLDGRENALYCSTLILRALSPYFEPGPLVFEDLQVPLFRGRYLYPQKFMEDPRSSLLFQVEAAAEPRLRQ